MKFELTLSYSSTTESKCSFKVLEHIGNCVVNMKYLLTYVIIEEVARLFVLEPNSNITDYELIRISNLAWSARGEGVADEELQLPMVPVNIISNENDVLVFEQLETKKQGEFYYNLHLQDKDIGTKADITVN